jgi:hypothetical protein
MSRWKLNVEYLGTQYPSICTLYIAALCSRENANGLDPLLSLQEGRLWMQDPNHSSGRHPENSMNQKSAGCCSHMFSQLQQTTESRSICGNINGLASFHTWNAAWVWWGEPTENEVSSKVLQRFFWHTTIHYFCFRICYLPTTQATQQLAICTHNKFKVQFY